MQHRKRRPPWSPKGLPPLLDRSEIAVLPPQCSSFEPKSTPEGLASRKHSLLILLSKGCDVIFIPIISASRSEQLSRVFFINAISWKRLNMLHLGLLKESSIYFFDKMGCVVFYCRCFLRRTINQTEMALVHPSMNELISSMFETRGRKMFIFLM